MGTELFKLKVIPINAYGLDLVFKHLTEKNLFKFIASCLAYVLAKEIYIENMIQTTGITVIDKHVWRTTLTVADQEKCCQE